MEGMIRMSSTRLVCSLAIAIGCFAQTAPTAPKDIAPGSITYDDVPYPYPVSYLPLTVYGQDVRMAYMDVPPSGTPNGRVVVLFHGMNFGGFYFKGPIDALRAEGFRVVAPDQIGFGRSSKPIIPYNFHDMAANSRKLLQTLGITKAAIVGHSMGGMLAARFAASYPDITERAVLYNPIGTTDPRWERPWRTADEAYKATMAQTPRPGMAGLLRQHPPLLSRRLEARVRKVRADPLRPPRSPAIGRGSPWVRAIYQQITYLDPVYYDWAHIKAKTLVFGGERDGENFPAQMKHIADTIPGSELVLIPGAGHVPHIQVPDVFNRELLQFLKK